MSEKLTPTQIQSWYPQEWSEITGNATVIRYFQNMIVNGPCSFVLTGPSRTGKTRIISLLIKALCCPHRTADLNPCNKCGSCNDVMDARGEHSGIFRNWHSSCCEFITIDCQKIQNREDLLEIENRMNLESEQTIVYLDEVAALRQRNRDEILLKMMDECKASWFASAVELKGPTKQGPTGTVQGISDQLLERFPLKLGTSLPDEPGLRSWIRSRCKAWEIDLVDPDDTLKIIVKKSGNVVGRVMHFLTAAAINNRRLDTVLAKEMSMEALD